MIRPKAFIHDQAAFPDNAGDGEDKLFLIDDAIFVNAFTEAGRKRGKDLICVRCLNPASALRAVVLLAHPTDPTDESAGSVGFCGDCYRDLAELLLNDSILRAAKPTES
jgi:hypothetical protein